MALLLAVALGAVVLGGLVGHRLSGSPVPVNVPGPPAAGACLVSLSEVPSVVESSRDDDAARYPWGVYGSCDGDVTGEITSVDRNRHPLQATTVASYLQASSECELSEVTYVGSIGPYDPTTLTTPGIAWFADVTVRSIAIGPNRLQSAAGQSWTACAAIAGDAGSYRGRLARALADGVLPPEFATCWRALVSSTEQQVDEQRVSCRQPHPVEILATAQITDPRTSPAVIAQSCVRMASRALRTSDPTVGGRLRITAYSMDGSSVMPVNEVNMLAGFVGCVASVPAPLRLEGTVIGLGDRPLPLAG